MTEADKRWLRKMVRQEFSLIINEMMEAESKQVGGYDGATSTIDPDEYEGRRRIGFSADRQGPDSEQ